MRDIDESLRLWRQAAKLGHRSVNIPAFPQSADGISTSARVKAIRSGQGAALTGDPTGQRSYAAPEFDRLWQEISDLDMTVTTLLGGRIPRFVQKSHFLPDMVMCRSEEHTSELPQLTPLSYTVFGLHNRYYQISHFK